MPEEEQETSGDFGSGGSVVLLDDLEDERELGPKDKEGKRCHKAEMTWKVSHQGEEDIWQTIKGRVGSTCSA